MKKRKGQMAGVLFLLPNLTGVCAFALVPMAEVVRRSFQSAVTSQWVGLKNYREVLGNTAFRLAVTNTLKFTMICIPLLIVLSLFLAVLLQKLRVGGRLLKSAFLLPVAVPAASVVLVWKVLFHSNGLINGILVGAGGEKVGWMTTDAAFWVLVISYLWKNLGYDMVLWMAGLAGIPTEIYEAARIDGAGHVQIFLKIGLPLGIPGVMSSMILNFLDAWNMIEQPMTFLKTKSLWPLSLFLPEIGLEEAGTGFAAAIMMLIPAMLLFFSGQDYLEQGIAAAALKE